MSILNKVLVCLCCSSNSCYYGCCYDCLASYESCALSYLNCEGCWWTICAPIPHSLSIGDFGSGMVFCVKGLKYCAYSCVLSVVAPIDGCINCLLYNKKNFLDGVKGIADITENTKFIANKVEAALDIKGVNQPDQTFKTFSP